jgi:hypothetical protein
LNGQQLKTAEYVLSPPTHPSTPKDHRSASISGGGSSGSGGSVPVSNPESLKNIRDSKQTNPQEGWNKAMRWLQQRPDDSSSESIRYHPENGPEKRVSIKEQILLDELYAKKLQAEEDLKPSTGFKKS